MNSLTDYQQHMLDRFFDEVFGKWPKSFDIGLVLTLDRLINGPLEENNELLAFEYIKAYPDATLYDIYQYWRDHTEYPSDPDWVWDLSDEEFEAMFPERFEDDDDEEGMTDREYAQMIYDRYKVYKKD